LREFAATLVAVIATESSSVLLHVGDGAIVLKSNDTWTIGSWPETGEYASTTFFVTDEAGPRLRFHVPSQAIVAFSIFTDGIERLVLDYARKEAHAPFFERMIEPVGRAKGLGRDRSLSKALLNYLDSGPVNERTDDDKTLVLAVRR